MTDVVYLNGWYDEERDGVHRFRWTGREAHCRLEVPRAGVNWLRVIASHPGCAAAPMLSVSADGALLGKRATRRGCFAYLFPFSTAGMTELGFRLDRTFQVPGDSRDLGLLVRSIDVVDVEQVDDPLDGEGWYEWEYGQYFPCRWMVSESRLLLPARLRGDARFATLPVYSGFEDRSQVLTVLAGESVIVAMPLQTDWHLYDFPLPVPAVPVGTRPLELRFRLNRVAATGDSRVRPTRAGRGCRSAGTAQRPAAA